MIVIIINYITPPLTTTPISGTFLSDILRYKGEATPITERLAHPWSAQMFSCRRCSRCCISHLCVSIRKNENIIPGMMGVANGRGYLIQYSNYRYKPKNRLKKGNSKVCSLHNYNCCLLLRLPWLPHRYYSLSCPYLEGGGHNWIL